MSSSPLNTASERTRYRVGSRFKVGERVRAVLIMLVNLTCFAFLWELFARYSGVPPVFLPRFSAILQELSRMTAEGILLPNLWSSVRVFGIGLAIGLVVGLPLAYAVGEIRFLDRVLSPYLWGLFSTPRIILLPLIMLWAGINDTARIVLIVISVVPSLAVVVMEGVKTVDPSLLRAARVFGASKLQLLRHVVIPSTIPVVGTGVRMGMLRGLIALYVGELFVTSHGIGALMAFAAARFRTARVFAVLLVFIVFSVAVLAASRFVEARMSKWRAGPEGQVF